MKIREGMEEEYQKEKTQQHSRYYKRIFSYAEEWALNMEIALQRGIAIKDSYREASNMADYDGVSGFVHRQAVAILKYFWKYGDDLPTRFSS